MTRTGSVEGLSLKRERAVSHNHVEYILQKLPKTSTDHSYQYEAKSFLNIGCFKFD